MGPVAVFFGTEEGIKNAYGAEIRAKIAGQTELLPGFYDAAALKNGMFPPELKDAEFVFSTWGMPALGAEEIARLTPGLKAVFYAAGSVRYFAEPFLDGGVRIFSAWGANGVPVAEFTEAQIILANKGFFQSLHRGGAPEWTEHEAGKPVAGNYGARIGIIGAGMIGTMVIERLRNHVLETEVFDPFMSEERAKALGVKKVSSLPQLFADCRVVSNHLANNPQTVGMIDRTCFEKMDPRGVFINTGRGQQVVEADLIAALKECPGRAAVLDVTWPEPPEKGSELYTLPNVFLTPHIAGSLGAEILRMGEYMYDEFDALLNGRPVKYEVSKEMLKTMA